MMDIRLSGSILQSSVLAKVRRPPIGAGNLPIGWVRSLPVGFSRLIGDALPAVVESRDHRAAGVLNVGRAFGCSTSTLRHLGLR